MDKISIIHMRDFQPEAAGTTHALDTIHKDVSLNHIKFREVQKDSKKAIPDQLAVEKAVHAALDVPIYSL